MKFCVAFLLFFTVLGAFSQKLEQGSSQGDFQKRISLFPNPATEFLNVKVEGSSPSEVSLKLFNIIGNELLIDSEVLDQEEIRIKIKDLPSGYYLLAIRDERTGQRASKKFLRR